MKITIKKLMRHNPCSSPERIEGFLACFPDGIVTLEGVQKAKAYKLDWVARELLPSDRWAEYEAKTAPLWADYLVKRASLLAANHEAKIAPLWADYEAKIAPLWVDYLVKRAFIFYEAFKE